MRETFHSLRLHPQRASLAFVLIASLFNATMPQSALAMGPAITTPPPDPVYWYHADHLGSSSVLTDAAGQVVQEVAYLPYGEVRANRVSGGFDTPFKYTGQESDEESGLYFYNARYYDPGLGRFITPDPGIPGGVRSPQSFNRYSYVNNSPLNFLDPTGRDVVESFLIGLVAGGVGGVVGYYTQNPILAGMAAGMVAGAIAGGIHGGFKGAMEGAAQGGAIGAFGGGIAWAGGSWGVGFMVAASIAAGYVQGGWSGVMDVMAGMAGGIMGGMIGYGLASLADPTEALAQGGPGAEGLEMAERWEPIFGAKQELSLETVMGDKVRVTAEYGETGPLWEGGHTGIDIVKKTGSAEFDPYYAPAAGQVKLGASKPEETVVFRLGAGNRSVITFSHGSPAAYVSKTWTNVSKGEYLGSLVRAPGTTGIHLHIQVQYGNKLYNPYNVFIRP